MAKSVGHNIVGVLTCRTLSKCPTRMPLVVINQP